MSLRSLLVSASVLLVWIIARNPGVEGYLLRNPGVFDLRSIELLVRRALVPLAFTGLLCALAAALGRRLMSLLFGSRIDPAADLPGASFALGAGALACGVFVLGLLGALNASGLCILGILFFSWAWPEFRLPRPRGWSQPLLAGVLAACAWHVLIIALAPPTEWDTLAYHLALPKLYLKSGGISEVPWLPQSHWPHLMEVFYAVPLSFGMENAAALWHASLCAAWIFSVWGFGRRIVGGRAAWFAVALLAIQPVMLYIAGLAHSDGALAYFTFMAAAAVWLFDEKGGRPWLILAGLFAGLAGSCKLHGIFQIASLTAWIAWRRKGFRDAGVFLVCALLIPSPWYLLTYARTGNPFWPLLSKIFGGTGGASVIEDRFLKIGFWRSPAALLNYAPQYLLLPSLALYVIGAGRMRGLPGFLKFYLGLAVPYILFVSTNDSAWRYMMGFLPAAALAAGFWAEAAILRLGWRRLAALLALAFSLSPNALDGENNQLFCVLGLRSRLQAAKDPREIYLERTLNNYGMFSRINRELGPEARILLFRETRGYYLDADYLWGDPINQGLILYSELQDGAALLARLSELGITHVLINEGIEMNMENPAWHDRRATSLMEEALRLGGAPVVKYGFLTLFELGRARK